MQNGQRLQARADQESDYSIGRRKGSAPTATLIKRSKSQKQKKKLRGGRIGEKGG